MTNNTERRSALLFPRQRKILAAMGENIKLARKRRQFTQKLVSERAGISPVTLRVSVHALSSGSEPIVVN